ncbi:unnamed protein product [Lathyrus sativus]|nr:unnamed protein product [Lathyrus sativus]
MAESRRDKIPPLKSGVMNLQNGVLLWFESFGYDMQNIVLTELFLKLFKRVEYTIPTWRCCSFTALCTFLVEEGGCCILDSKFVGCDSRACIGKRDYR